MYDFCRLAPLAERKNQSYKVNRWRRRDQINLVYPRGGQVDQLCKLRGGAILSQAICQMYRVLPLVLSGGAR